MRVEVLRDSKVAEIIARLQDSKGAVKVEGTWGSFAHLLTACVWKELGRPIVHVCPHIDDADKATDDLQTFGAKSAEHFPAWEGQEELPDATDEIRAERLRITLKLLGDKKPLLVTTSIQALCQPVPDLQEVAASSLQLNAGQIFRMEKVLEWLVENGFERVDRIDLPGQFAHRGGIVDIYAPVTAGKVTSGESSGAGKQDSEAIRVEFFGDEIESIRNIDLDTHRSSQQIETVGVVSIIGGAGEQRQELFFNLLPKETLLVFEEPADCQEVAKLFISRIEGEGGLYDWGAIYSAAEKFSQLHICRFAGLADEEFIKVGVKSVQQYQHKAGAMWSGHKETLEQLVNEAKKGKKVFLYCEALAEIKRIKEIIKQEHEKIPSNFKLVHGFINQGFAIDSLKTIVISHHELFGQFALRRKFRPGKTYAPVDTLADLQQGDYVVHASYGIGRFCGIKTIKEKAAQSEYLTIEYADGVKIQVSVHNIALVQKYIGTSPKRPRLSKVGSKKWQKQKEKVAKSVQDLAAELLEVQAKRQAIGGIKYGPDTNWQMEFEESFPYQETSDQISAIEQIKADMRQNIAMDRLLCGDVGYGKTELAMRAAFKTAENGKQVAMLVPTTVLCVQHGRTFAERFADFPVCIEVLNRFKTTKQAKDIIERTRAGLVDVLIGTHRLFSGDVKFKDLGLLIIDEEQRFGVEHKERLKRLRVNVDVLTMTATPIPRTLHMSLLGLRDISSLATPPLDRRSIVTSVAAYNEQLIRKAILRELNRQGQVFFLHNRVKTIEKKAWEIQKLVGDAKVAIAHGQMAKSELEKAMIDFVVGEVDVLVCTTIIESGLDIPNANTIFIDNADRFGLAELHQLRGRVGRYKHRAYAYMLLPKNRSITPVAARRLKAIEEYSHLGAGFRIALRDLEIRGAGNILGAAQSGHIQLVGYQLYCELLADAVRKLKNERIEPIPSVSMELGFATYIPKNYIPADRSRMEIYRKIATARNAQDLKQLEDELADVYGPMPNQVEQLLQLAELRVAAGRLGIRAIAVSGLDLIFSFTGEITTKTKGLFRNTSGKVHFGDSTAYLQLGKNYFEPETLMSILRKILKAA